VRVYECHCRVCIDTLNNHLMSSIINDTLYMFDVRSSVKTAATCHVFVILMLG
jgi:hypothetical protein